VTAPLAWTQMMRLGLGRLGLAPDTFWGMTPAEFRAALEGAGLLPAGGDAMSRDRLEALMRAHPDRD